MRITRTNVYFALNRVKQFLKKEKSLGTLSKLHKSALYICRKQNHIFVDYSRKIPNVNFIYDDKEQHWAETDGDNIWLNVYKNYDSETLYLTLLHETLHGMFFWNNHEMCEKREHDIMYLINRKLI